MQDKIREYVKDVARLKGRPVSVCLLGYGTTNKAILKAISSHGDCREITVRQDGRIYDTPGKGVRIINGERALDNICEDIVFASPSFRRESLDLPNGAFVTSDTELFFKEHRGNVFLVSGSDGKSTVTTLTSLLLSPTFPDLFTGGNLGRPVAEATLSANAFLLELSSFNLRYLTPRSHRALLTNVTPNHLNWHADLDEYENTKARLLKGTDEAILPLSCPFNIRLADDIECFALVSLTDSDTELRSKHDTRHTVTVSGDTLLLDGEELLSIQSLRRKEKHNIENLMSAIAMSIGYASKERIREVAESFTGLAHRCELITIGKRDYIDSSIDTTPERTAATVTGLDREVNIILGGRGKGLSPLPMKKPLITYAKKISLYGEAADGLCEWISTDAELSKIPHEKFSTLKDAIDHADDENNGTAVLLSPAATAYGEFKSFEERGCFFKEYVKRKRQEI